MNFILHNTARKPCSYETGNMKFKPEFILTMFKSKQKRVNSSKPRRTQISRLCSFTSRIYYFLTRNLEIRFKTTGTGCTALLMLL